MYVLFHTITALAAISWIIALVSWVLAIRHRKPEVGLTTFVFSGYKSFDPDLFTPEGQRHQRRFLLGFVGFFACTVAAWAMIFAFGGR